RPLHRRRRARRRGRPRQARAGAAGGAGGPRGRLRQGRVRDFLGAGVGRRSRVQLHRGPRRSGARHGLLGAAAQPQRGALLRADPGPQPLRPQHLGAAAAGPCLGRGCGPRRGRGAATARRP
ncbi:unnamed protein product, partial [Prorocentrum cordatum]